MTCCKNCWGRCSCCVVFSVMSLWKVIRESCTQQANMAFKTHVSEIRALTHLWVRKLYAGFDYIQNLISRTPMVLMSVLLKATKFYTLI